MTRASIENALADLKEVLKSDDAALIRKKIDALTTASHKLAEVIYSTAAQGGAGGAGTQAGHGAGAGGPSKQGEDVVDAEFEEVKGDKG
jgi:molecular chaperone DnaK